jgi:hypothetical protein
MQPANEGVTLMVAVTGDPVLFVAMNEGMFPLPEEANPIVGDELVHAKLAPGVPVNVTVEVLVPAHKVCPVTAFATGIGFTVTNT